MDKTIDEPISFPEDLHLDFEAWRHSGFFPKAFLHQLENDFDGTAFQHLFSGMTCYVFNRFEKAAHHLQIAVKKDEDLMSRCTEMGVFHRVSKEYFNKNLFDIIDDTEIFIQVLKQLYTRTRANHILV